MNSPFDYIQGFSADARENVTEREIELFFENFAAVIHSYRGGIDRDRVCLFVTGRGLAGIRPLWGEASPPSFDNLSLFSMREEATCPFQEEGVVERLFALIGALFLKGFWVSWHPFPWERPEVMGRLSHSLIGK